MKKKYFIRLYRAHDLDLITFVQSHRFNLNHALYVAITAFSKRDIFVIAVPPQKETNVEKFKRVYSYSLILDTEKDAKAIEVLEKIKPGFKNNFLKNLLRIYLCYPLSEAFLSNEADLSIFEEKLSGFKVDRRIAEAGFEKGAKKKRKKKSSERKKTLENQSEANEMSSNEKNDMLSEEAKKLINDVRPDVEVNSSDYAINRKQDDKQNFAEDNDEDAEITDMFMNMVKK